MQVNRRYRFASGRPVDERGVSGPTPVPGDWTSQAACLSVDPEALFVQGKAQHRAKTVCGACPVRLECLAEALDNRIEFGVWGGMTERARRALLRRRPNVVSWRRLLETARAEHERLVAATGPAAVPQPVPGRPAPSGAVAVGGGAR